MQERLVPSSAQPKGVQLAMLKIMSTSPSRFTARKCALRLRCLFLLSSLFALACGTTQRAETVSPAASTTKAPASSAALGPALYSAEEALRDALSGPLEHVGTGRWPGVDRMYACAFRNARVLVVNVYCTLTETPAFAVQVYSPTRGRARIYAESRGPVSEHSRKDYFTFTAESEPPPGPEARVAPLRLGMSFLDLHVYETERHRAFLPACYGGIEFSRERSGCLDALAPRKAEWTAQNRSFFANANDDWYRLVRALRSQAQQHGKEPDE